MFDGESMPSREEIPLALPEKAPEKDPLWEELLPPLSDDDEYDLATAVMSDHKAAILDRQNWEKMLVLWEEQYLGILPEKTMPWPGCANFHVPITMLCIETLKPRLVESIMGTDQPVHALPTEAMDEKKRDTVEQFVNWQIQSEMKIDATVAESAHIFLSPGTAVAKSTWARRSRKAKYIRSFPTTTPVDQIFKAIFGQDIPAKWDSVGKNKWEGYFEDERGVRRDVAVTFKISEDQIQVLVAREDVTYDGPDVSLLASEDFVAPFNGGADVQKLPWCQQVLWWTESDLRRKVRQKRLDKSRVDELLGEGDQAKGENSVEGNSQAITDLRSRTEGVDPDPQTDVRQDQYKIIEDYRLWDLDGDGEDEEIVCWVAESLPGKILGWDYLDNVFMTGKRPFVIGRPFPMPGRFYGMSFCEMVRGIQEEINTIHNQRVDIGTLVNTPGGWVRAGSDMSIHAQPMRPGEFRPIANPQTDIVPFQWNGSTVWGQNEEALLYQYLERLTGISDLSLGRQPNRVGATRTATGVASLLSEAGLRFKSIMLAFQRFWTAIFEQILALDQQYLPPGREFRVTGRFPEILKVKDKSELAGKFDLRLSATTETLNKETLREDATVKLNAALNPIALQLQLIGAKGLHRLYREFYRVHGETDPDLIVETLKMPVVYTPDQKLAIWENGGDSDPTPLENLQQTIELCMSILNDPTYEPVRKELGEEGLVKVQMHLAKALQLAQMQMAMQSMQGSGKDAGGMGATPAVGDQRQNAQMGAQAPQQPGGFGQGGQPSGDA